MTISSTTEAMYAKIKGDNGWIHAITYAEDGMVVSLTITDKEEEAMKLTGKHLAAIFPPGDQYGILSYGFEYVIETDIDPSLWPPPFKRMVRAHELWWNEIASIGPAKG